METALEHILTHYYKDEMISYMLAHREYFDDMIKLAIFLKNSVKTTIRDDVSPVCSYIVGGIRC